MGWCGVKCRAGKAGGVKNLIEEVVLLNIKQFIFVFLATMSSIIAYGNDRKGFECIFYAISKQPLGDNRVVDFNCLTPEDESCYLPQINKRKNDWTPAEAAVLSNNSALHWLVKKGCNLKENSAVLQIAIDRYQSYHRKKSPDDLDVIALLLEHGASTTIPMEVNAVDLDIEALPYAKAKLDRMRSKNAVKPRNDLKRQEQLVALLERFESPYRWAWMGAVYKGCLVREGRVAGAGTPVLSSKRVKLVE